MDEGVGIFAMEVELELCAEVVCVTNSHQSRSLV